MPFDLTELSDENGNVDPVKVKEWLAAGDDETDGGVETPEIAQKICKAIGYDFAKPMKFEVFLKRYVFVKMFLGADKDKSGFLERSELKQALDASKEDENEINKLYEIFDVNADGKISLGNNIRFII